jgi:WD40 repeat protein
MESTHKQDIIPHFALFGNEDTSDDEYYTIEITSIRPVRHPRRKAQQPRHVRLGLTIVAICIVLTGTSIGIISYLQSISITANARSPLWTFSATGAPEATLNWSANGTQLSFPTKSFAELQMYNLSTQRLIQYPDISKSIYQRTNNAQEIDPSPNGRYITIIDYNPDNHLKDELFIWDSLSGNLLFHYTYHRKQTTGEKSVSLTTWWSADNTQMATLDNDGSLIIWQASSGKPPFNLNDAYVPFNYVTWSANGKEIAANTASGHVEIWDLAKKARISLGLVSPTITNLTFSPNNQHLAALDNDSLYVLSTYTGTITVDNALSLPIVHGAPVMWSANSQYMIVTGQDAEQSTSNTTYSAAVWDIFASRQIMTTPVAPSSNTTAAISMKGNDITLQVPHDNQTVIVSPDRRYMATLEANGNTVNVWDINTGRKVSTHHSLTKNSKQLFAWSPDGKYLAGTFKNDEMSIWNAQTGTDVMIFDQQSGIKSTSSSSIQAIQWSPDSSYIAILNADLKQDVPAQYTIDLWNTFLN